MVRGGTSDRDRAAHARDSGDSVRARAAGPLLMIPSLAIHVGTVVAFFAGFGMGWWWRGWRDRELATELLARSEEHDRDRRIKFPCGRRSR